MRFLDSDSLAGMCIVVFVLSGIFWGVVFLGVPRFFELIKPYIHALTAP